MPKTPDEMAEAMIANMKEKTGKTLEQWIAIARKMGAAKHGEIVKILKSDHGMTHGFANLVAHKTLKSDAGSSTTDPCPSRCTARPPNRLCSNSVQRCPTGI